MQNQNNKAQNNLSMNDFEIISKLGKGSFGVVYKVKKKSNKSIYVMKQINISSMKSKMRNIALNEVKILKSLENPYVVKYYDSFIERDQLNIIMEYCEGGDLSQYIKGHTGKQVAEAKIWKFFIQMCVGLNYIHNKKILHRDIKALNIFLTKDGDIRIGDLGVAKILADSVNFAHTMVGTPYYLSPEMCEEKPYNEKSDIWALGCVLYELCVQKHPFQAHSQGTLILKIIKGRYTPVSSFYSQELIEIVNLCLNRDYKKRPTASTLLTKQSVIDKAKSLNISLQPIPRDPKPIMGMEGKPKKEPEVIVKETPAVAKDGIVGVGVGVRPTENKVEKKVKNNNEGKVHVFLKNELLPKKIENEVIKPAAPTPVNKIEIVFKNPVPVKPKENIEIVAKAISDKKPSAPVNNLFVGEKIVNKPLPVSASVNKDRVRKGAPVELSRQAKNAAIQQKLVKKVNVEAPKIFRPPLLEDKEKAPLIKSPAELAGGQIEKKKSKEEYKVEITAEELDEVKNLPDIVMPNQAQKEVVKSKPVKEKVVPSVEEEVKFEKKIQKPQKEVSASGAGGIVGKKEEIIIESEEIATVQKIDYQRENWQVANEEKNLKVVKTSDNQQDEEFKFGQENEEDIEIEEDQPKEDDSEDEEEEEGVEQKDLQKEVLVKKLEKSLKKKQKIQNMIEEIKSNKYIKALGDKAFQEIINFFKIKLESEDEINEDDQDEIENFLKGKLSPELQVQVIYNIYRLLGLQIELQKCEEGIKQLQKYI